MGKKPTPKLRLTKSKGRMRHSHFRYDVRKRLKNMVNLVPCSNCKALRMAHMVCMACGYYRGRMVIDKSTQVKKKITTITA